MRVTSVDMLKTCSLQNPHALHRLWRHGGVSFRAEDLLEGGDEEADEEEDDDNNEEEVVRSITTGWGGGEEEAEAVVELPPSLTSPFIPVATMGKAASAEARKGLVVPLYQGSMV